MGKRPEDPARERGREPERGQACQKHAADAKQGRSSTNRTEPDVQRSLARPDPGRNTASGTAHARSLARLRHQALAAERKRYSAAPGGADERNRD